MIDNTSLAVPANTGEISPSQPGQRPVQVAGGHGEEHDNPLECCPTPCNTPAHDSRDKSDNPLTSCPTPCNTLVDGDAEGRDNPLESCPTPCNSTLGNGCGNPLTTCPTPCNSTMQDGREKRDDPLTSCPTPCNSIVDDREGPDNPTESCPTPCRSPVGDGCGTPFASCPTLCNNLMDDGREWHDNPLTSCPTPCNSLAGDGGGHDNPLESCPTPCNSPVGGGCGNPPESFPTLCNNLAGDGGGHDNPFELGPNPCRSPAGDGCGNPLESCPTPCNNLVGDGEGHDNPLTSCPTPCNSLVDACREGRDDPLTSYPTPGNSPVGDGCGNPVDSCPTPCNSLVGDGREGHNNPLTSCPTPCNSLAGDGEGRGTPLESCPTPCHSLVGDGREERNPLTSCRIPCNSPLGDGCGALLESCPTPCSSPVDDGREGHDKPLTSCPTPCNRPVGEGCGNWALECCPTPWNRLVDDDIERHDNPLESFPAPSNSPVAIRARSREMRRAPTLPGEPQRVRIDQELFEKRAPQGGVRHGRKQGTAVLCYFPKDRGSSKGQESYSSPQPSMIVAECPVRPERTMERVQPKEKGADENVMRCPCLDAASVAAVEQLAALPIAPPLPLRFSPANKRYNTQTLADDLQPAMIPRGLGARLDHLPHMVRPGPEVPSMPRRLEKILPVRIPTSRCSAIAASGLRLAARPELESGHPDQPFSTMGSNRSMWLQRAEVLSPWSPPMGLFSPQQTAELSISRVDFTPPAYEEDSDQLSLRFAVPAWLVQTQSQVASDSFAWPSSECSKPHPLDSPVGPSGLGPDNPPHLPCPTCPMGVPGCQRTGPQCPWKPGQGGGDQTAQTGESSLLLSSLDPTCSLPILPSRRPEEPSAPRQARVSTGSQGSQQRAWNCTVRRPGESQVGFFGDVTTARRTSGKSLGISTCATWRDNSECVRTVPALHREESAAREDSGHQFENLTILSLFSEMEGPGIPNSPASSYHPAGGTAASTVLAENPWANGHPCLCLGCTIEQRRNVWHNLGVNSTTATCLHPTDCGTMSATSVNSIETFSDGSFHWLGSNEERSTQPSSGGASLAIAPPPRPPPRRADGSCDSVTRQQVVDYLLQQLTPSRSNPDGIEAYAATHPAELGHQSHLIVGTADAAEVIHQILMSGFLRTHDTRGEVADMVDNYLEILIRQRYQAARDGAAWRHPDL